MDTIWDFTFYDHITLTNCDADVTRPGDQYFSFIGIANFTRPGQIRYDHYQGDTYLYLNVDAHMAQDAGIRIEGIHTPNSNWFNL